MTHETSQTAILRCLTPFDSLPNNALLKIDFVIGNSKKGIIGVFPVSRSAWYAGIQKGIYPQSVNLAGGKSVAWKVSDIRALLESQK